MDRLAGHDPECFSPKKDAKHVIRNKRFHSLVFDRPDFSALLLSYCHKKQENLFAPLRLCFSARDILVAAIRIRQLNLLRIACFGFRI
jgi:hypothetical protein